MIEVIATPSRSPNRLIESLSLNTVKPDMVTLVTNGDHDIRNFGLNVRVLRFASDTYAIGDRDVALRCNVGVWESSTDNIIFQGDDQIASPTMIADSTALLRNGDHFWGHHRFIEFGNKSVPEIMALPADAGRSREHGVNRTHAYLSCYSGMFGVRTSRIKSIGGFDMAFNCRHAGEDQQLGKRLSGPRVVIHEPPFSWHPTDPNPWESLGKSNLCGNHRIRPVRINGYKFLSCYNCPWAKYDDSEERLYSTVDPVIQYEHDKVSVEEVIIDAS